MINMIKKGEWNVAKGPNPKNQALKQIRKGRPTMIHNTASKGTFVGDLKKTYKFGPEFSNADRKVTVSPKASAAKATQVIEKKQIAVVKKQIVATKWRTIWFKFRNWLRSLFKKGGKR